VPRALVALLALNAGTVVTQSRLVDAIWGENPPRTAIRTLQSHLARVRQAFDQCGPPNVVLTKDPGYVLALWRGDALADAEADGWAAAEVDRLHGMRLSASEDLWRRGSSWASTLWPSVS
jgi:DNA-binding SARP family transcriptional activator